MAFKFVMLFFIKFEFLELELHQKISIEFEFLKLEFIANSSFTNLSFKKVVNL